MRGSNLVRVRAGRADGWRTSVTEWINVILSDQKCLIDIFRGNRIRLYVVVAAVTLAEIGRQGRGANVLSFDWMEALRHCTYGTGIRDLRHCRVLRSWKGGNEHSH
jgi:hypothetical protein